jgi:small subunit ribosomal protein S15
VGIRIISLSTRGCDMEEDKLQDNKVEETEKSSETKKKSKIKSKVAKERKKPLPAFVEYTQEEVERIILKLAKEGKTQSEIGLILRDSYGIPTVKIYGLKISKILKKHGLEREIPEDLFNLLKKAVQMHNHMLKHKKDKYCRHRFQLIEDKIRRLVKYYKSTGKLPTDWKYDIERAKLIVK